MSTLVNYTCKGFIKLTTSNLRVAMLDCDLWNYVQKSSRLPLENEERERGNGQRKRKNEN